MARAGGTGSTLSAALQVVGATAGLGALATVIGGAMLWTRFDALDLPAAQAVAMLPERLLLVIGLHAVVVPLLVGLAVLIFLLLINPLDGNSQPRPRFGRVLAVIAVLGGIVVVCLVKDYDARLILAVLVMVVFGAFVIWRSAKAQRTRGQHIALVVFAVFAFTGGVLAVVRTAGRPQMEPAAVLLNDGERGVAGFYIGQTDDRVYLATLPGSGDASDPFADAPIDRVVELPREEVLRIAIRHPTELGPADAGRDQAQTLLADLLVQQLSATGQPPPREVVRTADPAAAFAPLAHLHSEERYWPMSADEFLRNGWLLFRHGGRCPPWSFALDAHLPDAGRAREQIMGRIDPARLGGDPSYGHPASTAQCPHAERPSFSATQRTRPFDPKGRPKGLPEEQGFYIDLWDERRAGARRTQKRFAQLYFVGVPAYWQLHRERVGDADAVRITYWMFYGLSQPPGPKAVLRRFRHEGDWERISVLLEHRGGSDSYVPVSVRYHFHDENRDVPWHAVRRVAAESGGAATHPVAYIAKTSHASYPRAGRYEEEFRVRGRRVEVVHDEGIACPDCPQWETWQVLRRVTDEPWYGFGGAWGEVADNPLEPRGTTGPLGPSRYKTPGVAADPEETAPSVAPVPIEARRR